MSGRRVSHSQITPTLKPRARSSAAFLASRATFVANFSVQKSTRVFGVELREHPSWRCQKQPCTKIANRYFGSTMSGRPGRSRRKSRKRNPIACRVPRTTISGLVSRPRTLAISADLSGEGGASSALSSPPVAKPCSHGFGTTVRGAGRVGPALRFRSDALGGRTSPAHHPQGTYSGEGRFGGSPLREV